MADIIDSGDKETSLYLIQIQYLDEQLERCQLKCDELEKQNKELVSQYRALEKEKKDTTEHLKRSEVAKEKKVGELAAQLESQEQAAQRDQEALKLQHRLQIQQLQERLDTLDSESRGLEAKLQELQEQKEQLTERMQKLSNIESLKKQLASQKEKHEAAFHNLKKDAELKMKELIEKKQKEVDACFKKKAANILRKERALHGVRAEQLRFLHNETVVLQQERDILRDRERELQAQMDDLKEELNETTKQSLASKKEVEQLAKRSRLLEAELKERSITHQHVRCREETLRRCLVSEGEQCQQKTAEAGELRAELQRERSRRRQLEGVMQEVVILLRNILEDSEKGSDTRWKMQRLLEVLESPAPQGTGPALGDSTRKSGRRQKPPTSDSEPARKLCSQKTSSSVDPHDPAAAQRPPNPVDRKEDGCFSK